MPVTGIGSAAGVDPVASLVTALNTASTYAAQVRHNGTSWPARPSVSVPVQYVGPTAPTDAASGDRWYFVPTSRPVIWDTDWWTDVDDVAALRVLLWAERVGMVDVRAVVASATYVHTPGSIDAFLVAEDRARMPIGTPTTSHVPSGSPPYQTNMAVNNAHRAGYPSTVQDAVTVYRQTLAAASSSRKVDIITVGYLNNLSELLASPADSISSLTGAQLVAAKVDTLWVMGGLWPTGTENNFNRSTQAKTAASDVMANWPTPITLLGYEVGSTVMTGGNLLAAVATTDLLAKAMVDHGSQYGRPSWDPMMTLLACIGDPTAAGYTTVQGTGTVNSSTGANTWADSVSGSHKYVVKAWTDDAYVSQINALLVTATQTAATVPILIYQDGAWQTLDISTRTRGAAQVALPSRVTATVDVANLVMHLHADDLGDLTNGNGVAHWEDRMGNYPVRQTTSANRPVYAASTGGRRSVHFASTSNLQSDSLTVPRDLTVYVRARWATLPVSNQALIAQDTTGSSRAWHLKGTATPTAQAVSFTGGAGTADSAAAAIVQNQWHVITGRWDATTVEALVDGASNGTTAITNPNVPYLPFVLGSKQSDATAEGLVGDISEVRVYAARHSDAQVAAVIADMP